MNSSKNTCSVFAFVDEAGDTGLKLDRGSSHWFTIAVVIFSDDAELRRCDLLMDQLRKKLGKSDGFEFHFHNNNRQVREALLAAVAPVGFVYYAFTLNKNQSELWGDAFKNRESFYMTAAKMVFECASPHLHNSFVVIDKSGSRDFQSILSKYIRRTIVASGNRIIKRFRAERSSQRNLLQLADYVASICQRVSVGKADASGYHRQISLKEIQFKKWPR